MNLLHTSDWHVGRKLHGADLTAAHELFFSSLLDLIKMQAPVALLVSGDIFDRGIPQLNALNLVSDFLTQASKLTKIVITPGNHDSAERLGFLAPHLNGNVIIRASLSDMLKPVDLFDSNGRLQARIWPIPYLHPDQCRYTLARDFSDPRGLSNPVIRETITVSDTRSFSFADGDTQANDDSVKPLERSHQAVLQRALQWIGYTQYKNPTPPSVPIIIMSHEFVAGGLSSDSERNIAVGGIEVVSSDIFTNYGGLTAEMLGIDTPLALPIPSYVALGHLHRPQQIKNNANIAMYYSGSPIAFSFSEAGTEKCVKQVNLDKQNVTVSSISTAIFRSIAEIRGTFEELIKDPKHIQHADCWIKATVTDKIPPSHLTARLKQHYPHLLVVQKEASLAVDKRALNSLSPKQTNPLEICERFFQTGGFGDLTPNQHWILRDCIESIQHRGEH